MTTTARSDWVQHVDRARERFADRNPQSRLAYESAREVLPGGHTRTVLTHAPFPLTFVSGEGATLTDADDAPPDGRVTHGCSVAPCPHVDRQAP